MFKKTQIALMVFVVMSFVVTSAFIFPQADDFSYTLRVHELGFLDAQISEYLNWTGRYTATALLSLSPMVWGNLSCYRFLPVLLILLIFLSSCFLARSAFSTKLQKGEEYFWGLTLTFLVVSGFHTTAEGLYWLASSYSYTIAIVFLNLALAFVLTKRFRLASLFGLLLTGTNETSMVLWLYILCVLGFFQWLRDKSLSKDFVVTFLISFVGALIMLKSPGNAIRAAHFEKGHDIVRTISNALVYSFIDPFKFLTLPLIAVSILNFERIKEIFDLEAWKKHRAFFIFAMMGLFFMTFAPSLWGMGRRPNTRTMNVIVHAYTIGFFPVILMFFSELRWKKWVKFTLPFFLLSSAFLGLASDYVSGRMSTYEDLWRRNLATNGADKIRNKAAPQSIHFKFLEYPSWSFESFKRNNPNFYKD